MSIISRMRKQTAVYWEPSGRDSFGRVTYELPVQISCRWEDKRVMFLDATGAERVSNSVVYVDRVLEIRGFLKRGTLEDLVDNSPLENEGVYEIRNFEELPNLRNTETLLTAIL